MLTNKNANRSDPGLQHGFKRINLYPGAKGWASVYLHYLLPVVILTKGCLHYLLLKIGNTLSYGAFTFVVEQLKCKEGYFVTEGQFHGDMATKFLIRDNRKNNSPGTKAIPSREQSAKIKPTVIPLKKPVLHNELGAEPTTPTSTTSLMHRPTTSVAKSVARPVVPLSTPTSRKTTTSNGTGKAKSLIMRKQSTTSVDFCFVKLMDGKPKTVRKLYDLRADNAHVAIGPEFFTSTHNFCRSSAAYR